MSMFKRRNQGRRRKKRNGEDEEGKKKEKRKLSLSVSGCEGFKIKRPGIAQLVQWFA